MGHIALLHVRLFFYAVVGGLIATCIVFILLGRHAIADHLHDWKLLPRPERLTELYFTQHIHTHLPVTFKPGVPQDVTFTIHNLEHRATSYHYHVVAQTPEKRQVLGEGTVMLEHDRAQKISRTITIPRMGQRVAVRVILEYSGISYGQDSVSTETQEIYYWANSAL